MVQSRKRNPSTNYIEKQLEKQSVSSNTMMIRIKKCASSSNIICRQIAFQVDFFFFLIEKYSSFHIEKSIKEE
jgi:hypothetical protein